MVNKHKKILCVVYVLLVSGCASIGKDEYSCPGSPQGLTCTDSMSVYEMTNDPKKAREILKKKKEEFHGHSDSDVEVVNVPVSPHRYGEKMKTPSQPVPILKEAEVLRIWLAPWQDEMHDLHWPGYVFTEITPRRWTISEEEVKDTKVLTPVPYK